MQDLRSFCVDQIQRLSVFPRFDFIGTEGQRVLRDWLERRGDDTPETRAGIARLIDTAIELDQLPTPADLSRIWQEQHPPRATASYSCEYCQGSGWEIVERGGVSGALRCRCGGVPVADPSVAFVGVAA